MSRKLYALIILIWSLAFLVLLYLYFFVYYTATLVIDANVGNYRVELFSSATAGKWSHECETQRCVIPEVSPFEYTISIIKEDYETKIISAKVSPRRQESIVVQLEKRADLVSFEKVEVVETNKQKIQRLREENLFYARFQLVGGSTINFVEQDDEILMRYNFQGEQAQIQTFPKINSEDIRVDAIGSSDNIFITLAKNTYIFDTDIRALYKLPYTINIDYIKSTGNDGNYLIVTKNGSFLYNISNESSQFQYIFKDFLYSGEDLIGVVFADEEQKKSNFWLGQNGNLIVKYSPEDKTRKVLYSTNLSIDRLEWKDDTIIVSSGDETYELKNFD